MGPESSSAAEESSSPVFRETSGRSTAGRGVAMVSGSCTGGTVASVVVPPW